MDKKSELSVFKGLFRFARPVIERIQRPVSGDFDCSAPLWSHGLPLDPLRLSDGNFVVGLRFVDFDNHPGLYVVTDKDEAYSFYHLEQRDRESLFEVLKKLLKEELNNLFTLYEKIDKAISKLKTSLVLDAGVWPKDYKQALAYIYEYHDGFNHLTRDDDFLAVRCGDHVVEKIYLPGNDLNDLKAFLKAGGDRVLSLENVAKFRKAAFAARKAKVIKDLLSKKQNVSGGLKIK